jgi:hypothetical protein
MWRLVYGHHENRTPGARIWGNSTGRYAACHGPAELPQIIKQRGNFSLPDRIVFKPRDYHTDPPHRLRLLRARATSGQAAAASPSILMNSRRLQ